MYLLIETQRCEFFFHIPHFIDAANLNTTKWTQTKGWQGQPLFSSIYFNLPAALSTGFHNRCREWKKNMSLMMAVFFKETHVIISYSFLRLWKWKSLSFPVRKPNPRVPRVPLLQSNPPPSTIVSGFLWASLSLPSFSPSSASPERFARPMVMTAREISPFRSRSSPSTRWRTTSRSATSCLWTSMAI